MDYKEIVLAVLAFGGSGWGVWNQILKNKGELNKAQTDELSKFRAELRADCDKLEGKITIQNERIESQNKLIVGLRGELTTVRTDFASYRTLVRLMVVQINHGNPLWRDLATILTSDSEIDKMLKEGLAASPSPLPEVPVRAQKRILVVDDYPDTRNALEQFLKAKGYEVVSVGSGTDALSNIDRSQLESRPFDLVLLDYAMPTLTGIDTLQVIRNGATPPKVVIVTGHPEELADLQGETVWTKPLDFSSLDQRVKDAMV